MELYRNFISQEEIDLEYNLSLSIPEIGDWLEWYRQESLTARKTLDCTLDVRFGPTVDETIDIFPAPKQNSPIVVFIHGGYWVRCSSKDFSFVANGLVNCGITVVVINYSLCPKVSIAEVTRQSRAVIAWLYKEAACFNGDPARIFVSGHSAGGQQVGMLLSTDWKGEYDLPSDVLKGGISISGIFDLHPLRYSYLQPKLLLTHGMIMRESPNFNIPTFAPPLLVSFGKEETAEFQRQSKDYLHEWQARGLKGELLVQEGKHHFSAIEELNVRGSDLCREFYDFVVQCEKTITAYSHK